MAYLPPVNLPNLQDRDYAAQLHGMIGNVGEAYYGAKRDKIGDAQWQQEQERLSTAQALAQSNADRNYALELDKFKWDQTEAETGGYAGTSMDAQNWNIIAAGPDHPMYGAAYNQLFEQPKLTSVQTDSGMQFIPQLPVRPDWVRPPPGMGGGSQPWDSAGVSDLGLTAQPQPGAPPPSGGNAGVGAPISVPGTTKDPEAVRTMKLKATTAYQTIDAELDRYVQLVEQGGIAALPGPHKDKMNAVRQGIMLQLKELFNLGVLNGPDLSLMERMIYDPVVDAGKEGGMSSIPDQLATGVLGGNLGVATAGDRAAESAAELRRMLGNIVNTLGGAQAPAQPQGQPLIAPSGNSIRQVGP